MIEWGDLALFLAACNIGLCVYAALKFIDAELGTPGAHAWFRVFWASAAGIVMTVIALVAS